MRAESPRRVLGTGAILLAVACLFLLAAGRAAAAPPQLWTKCDSSEPAGQQCDRPRGVAADSTTGHVFLADQGNQRIVELDPLGLFVRAWGWDVVASGPGNQSTEPEPPELEVCVPDAGDSCKAGVSGGGAGQFSAPLGVALDSAGSVYAVDFSNRRVQKFDRKGNFLLTFGGEVNQTKVEEGAPEAEQNLCPVDPGDVCKAGVQGTGNGQFGQWRPGSFIGVDTKGTETDADDEVYVGDVDRIQIFDAAGNYLEDWPDTEGTLEGETVTSLAVGPAGNLYVTYLGEPDVRKLTPAGVQLEVPRFAVPPPDEFTGRFVTAVAVRVDGHLFAFANPATGSGFVQLNRIFEFDPAGNVVDEFGKGEFGSLSHGLATNLCAGSEAPGNVYATNTSTADGFVRAYGTVPIGCFKARTLPATAVEETSATLNGTVNPDGALSGECRFEWGTTTVYGNSVDCAESEPAIGDGTEPVPVHADLAGLQAATTYHFRLRAEIGGETQFGPDEQFKTKGPPVISDEHAVAVTDSEAIVKAQVNPEGLPTSCWVEFGTGGAFDRSSPGTGIGEDRSEHAVAVTLGGLEPGTTYEWRFACDNTAVLGEGLAVGEERSLTTYRAFAADTDCPNQVLRGGASASLPDCRAYEMASPVEKNGADILAGLSGTGDPAGYAQVSPDRNKLTYATKGPPAFGEEPSASFTINQYLAERQAGGWSSEAIHAPYPGNRISGAVPGNFREFIAFSPELCSAWLVDRQDPPLNADGQDGYANLYRRQNCEPGKGRFETITENPVPAEAKADYVGQSSVQGTSEDSRHAIFVAEAPLTEDAAEGFNPQLYDRFGGANHLVSVLPDGSGGDPAPGDGMGFANPTGSAVGSGWNFNLEGAVSGDGSRVYWTAGIDNSGKGRIYLRLRPEQGIVAGECEAAGAPCTVPVSENLTTPFSDDAFFWQASPDGSKALYSEDEDLYLFDLASSESQLVAEDVIGVAGASEDLSRIYFVSRAELAEGAEEGEPNLYLAEGGGLAEGGSFSLVATLVEGDVGQAEPGATFAPYDLASRGTYARTTRVTPDGSQIAFQSRAALSEFDNTAAGGKPAVEVYTYRAGAGELLCVSCNPSGARPAAREMTPQYIRSWPRPSHVLAAAWIPSWEHPTYASKVLSEDGNRIFFNANDALVPRDANGAQDVYEWEAPGSGSCEVGDPSYFPQNGGCLYLISSGESSFESEFWGASAGGEDVFFTTESSLLPQDPGLVDLYDARVGGGFAQPVEAADCEGEACQSPPSPPEFPAPSSGAYRGPGNVVQRRNCRGPARRAQRLSRKAKGARRGARRAARANNRANARRMRRKVRRFARRAGKLSRNAKRCRRANRGRAAR